MVHREHAVVETAGVRTAKAMGLRGLPKTWQVNLLCGMYVDKPLTGFAVDAFIA